MEHYERVAESFELMAKFIRFVGGLIKKILAIWENIKEKVKEWYQLQEQNATRRNAYKINFTRMKIVNQVTDRKPRHINRKIIQ